jgi:hypothetical protein
VVAAVSANAERRTELKACGSTGDRAVIPAPQGLDYVLAFLGALQAGRIAVPLSQLRLADHGQHRAPSMPDLLVAATAAVANLTVIALDRTLTWSPISPGKRSNACSSEGIPQSVLDSDRSGEEKGVECRLVEVLADGGVGRLGVRPRVQSKTRLLGRGPMSRNGDVRPPKPRVTDQSQGLGRTW